MSRDRIDVSVEHNSTTIEYAVTPNTPWITGIAPVGRGPVQMVIDMPARSSRLFFSAAMAAVSLFVIAGGTWSLLGRVPNMASGGFLDHPFVTAGILATLSFVGLYWFTGVGASREILELDSRFVTLTRDRETVVTLPRGACNVLALSDAPTGGLPGLFATRLRDHPWLLLGNGHDWHVAAGSGISRESAERLADGIRAFMEEHPPDAGFDDPMGVVNLFQTDGPRS